MTVQRRNAEMVDLLRADLQGRYEPQFALAQYMATVQALPGLRGFWPMSSFNESGNAYDLSGQGRVLTYNGNPTYNWDGLAPYIDLDGTGDYLSRADEAGLDITGTESYVANPGLTLGGWFLFDVGGGTEELISKRGAGGDLGYWCRRVSTGAIDFLISVDGTASTIVSTATSATVTGGWYFIVCRFVPSTELSVFVNNQEAVNTTSIPASIFNSSGGFFVGGPASNLLTGRASLCFLCAAAHSDAIIGNLFQQSRALFGV